MITFIEIDLPSIMNRYILLFFTISLVSCQEIKKTDIYQSIFPSNKTINAIDTVLYSHSTKVVFLDTLYDLGNVGLGIEKTIIYRYKNAGDKPLMLFDVSPGCGCTIADYSHEPLLPNQVDSIIAKFISKSGEGRMQKTIKVRCNSIEKVHNLIFNVNIINK